MILALIQARLGSHRLPGKVLERIEGQPLIWHVHNRLSRAKSLDRVAVVTGPRESNIALVEFCEASKIPIFCGSEDDVLDRYVAAARHFRGDTIVRITGDCPLIDPEVVERVVRLFQSKSCDYASNVHEPTYPDGLDVEVMTLAALERAHKEARLSSEREHVTPYLWKHPEKFKLANLRGAADLSAMRWIVDDARDLAFVREVYGRLYRRDRRFSTRDILGLLKNEPAIAGINRGTQRNEGYSLSLQNDAPIRANGKNPGGNVMQRLNLQRSQQQWEKALNVIPIGTQMMSKTPAQFVLGEYPFYLASGKGAHVRDVDGNEYIDFLSAFGTVLLGHANPKVDAAVRRQLTSGIIYSLPHALEVQVAELLRELVPCAEMVRLFKTGSEATSAAVRIARAETGRMLIAKCASGYHGWHDWHAAGTARSAGIPPALKGHLLEFPYNDADALEKLFLSNPGKIACVIMEPVVLDEPKPGFLNKVRRLATKHGAALIFDEIVSGFRQAPGGAQEYYGVTPDLATFGKGISNGLPLSVVVGRKSIMKRFEAPDVFVSSTFGGETISLAAATVVLRTVAEDGVSDHIWKLGAKLKEGIKKSAQRRGLPIECKGLPPRMVFSFGATGNAASAELRTLFLQQCVRQGIIFGNVIFVNAAHTPRDIDAALQAVDRAFECIQKGLEDGSWRERIRGLAAAPVFNVRKT